MKNLAQIQIKIESAYEKKKQIMSSCIKQLESPNDKKLLKIGSDLGEFTTGLRSALNYSLGDFATNKLEPVIKPHLSKTDLRSLRRHYDFPYSRSKKELDKNRPVVQHIKKHFADVYTFLEKIQPYHPKNEWLKQLMKISNQDKHTVITEIVNPRFNAVAGLNPDGTPHRSPWLMDGKLIVLSGKSPHFHPLPCYYSPYHLFATKEEKWANFLILLDQEKLGLTSFIETVPKKIKKLIDEFYTLM